MDREVLTKPKPVVSKPPKRTEQEDHIAVCTEMAELCEQVGALNRAKQYREMIAIIQASPWSTPRMVDRTGQVRKNISGPNKNRFR